MATQPLHTLVTTLAAPTVTLSADTGDMSGAAEGVLHADVRVLAYNAVTVNGVPPVMLSQRHDADTTVFSTIATAVEGSTLDDPRLRVDRVRTVEPGRVSETFEVHSDLDSPRELVVELRLGTDWAPVQQLKGDEQGSPQPLNASLVDAGTIEYAHGDLQVELHLTGLDADLTDPTALRLSHTGTLAAGATGRFGWVMDIKDSGGVVIAARRPPLDVERIVDGLTGHSADGCSVMAVRWLRQSLNDLNGLAMATADRPEDTFFAAGSPWYLTLFGRDSLWTARMLASQDWRPAASTLRTLAARQGTKDDPQSAEAPGKIMHELRRGTYTFGDITLTPLYFGTIDATALWVCLLVDAWRAGMPEAEVRELLPNLRACLGWLTGPADADGDGFVEYVDASGHGLANQGWKDSPDSIRYHDGRQAPTPVALCEVQGYAYAASSGAAELLDALGEDGSTQLRVWANGLAERFRASFWCGSGDDRYPALALDADKRRVDSVTSNIGHLLGTGLLSDAEEKLVVDRLMADDLCSGLGLRTMSSRDAGYSPMSYHCGSVWPHDTAIVIDGLLRSGYADQARVLAQGLLEAAYAFDFRLPELWSGETAAAVPYPAACRPQAWSAAAAVVAVRALV